MGYSVLVDSPLFWLRLNEPSGTTAADSSGHGRNALFSGTGFTRGTASLLSQDADPSTTYAKVTSCQITHDAAFDFGTGDFTVECWVKTTDAGTNVAVGTDAGGGNPAWWLGVNSGKANVSLNNTNVVSSASVNDGVAHHLAATRASGTITLYVDGVSVATGSDGTSITSGGNIGIGDFPSLSQFNFTGVLDEPAVYGVALSVARIQSHYSMGALGYARIDATLSTGQAAMLLIPTAYAGGPATAIMFHHGAGYTETELVVEPLKAACVNALAQAGFILCGTNAQGENWGNAASQLDYVALRTYAAANYSINRWCFWGESMGGVSSLLCLRRSEFADVLSWLGTYPVCNLASMFASNAGTYAGEIRTAYGIAADGSDYAAKTAGFDPALLLDSHYAGKSFRFYSSSADTVVPKTTNTTQFSAGLAGIASKIVVVDTSGDHGDPSNFVPADYVAFFNTLVAAVGGTPHSNGLQLAKLGARL